MPGDLGMIPLQCRYVGTLIAQSLEHCAANFWVQIGFVPVYVGCFHKGVGPQPYCPGCDLHRG